jgi:hypothetical protein
VFKEKRKEKRKSFQLTSTTPPPSGNSLSLSFFFLSPLFIFLFPAAEVIKPESKNQSQLLVPSPILSPSLSTDEDSSVYSPNSHDLLDDLLDWNGQQHTL